MMRMFIGLVAMAALLAGCGNDAEIAAKKQELQKLEAQVKTLNAQMAEKRVEWQATYDKLIPLRGKLLHAKGTDREAEAKARYDEAAAASEEAQKAQDALRLQIQALSDKARALKKTISRLER